MFLNFASEARGGTHGELHVLSGWEIAVGDAHEVATAQVLGIGNFRTNLGEFFLNGSGELLRGFLLVACVQDDRYLVGLFCKGHVYVD